MGPFGAIFAEILAKKEFSWEKGLCQFLNIPLISHCANKQKKTNDPFLRK